MAIKFSDITGGGIPFGNNAGRPANPGIGKLYSNGETQRLELYTSAGSWENIVQEVPGVSSISGDYSEQTDSGVILIYGTNFVSGAVATAIGSNGVQVNAQSTVYNSLVQLTATFTGLSNAYEPYDIKVTNPSNLFGLIPDALYINASPVWQTSSGSLGSFTEQVSITLSALSASDSDSTVTYALASGSSLPSGVTLNSTTGVISGTLPDIESSTTYTFTINASDGINIIPRTFSITSVIPEFSGAGTLITSDPTYFYRVFTSTGTLNIANASADVEAIILGGGGGGGSSFGGGGGAGALVVMSNKTVTPGSYSIVVGNGAARNTPADSIQGLDGESSSAFSVTALGGGGGGAYNNSYNGRPGGCGGGAGTSENAGTMVGGATTQQAQSGTTFYANRGGNSFGRSPYIGTGGGGTGAQGQDITGGNTAGSGGNGTTAVSSWLSIINSVMPTAWQTATTGGYIGGGGGGAAYQENTTAGSGGLGGAANGVRGTGSTPGLNSVDHTGSGGGGGGYPAGGGGSGGKGLVVIRYPKNKSINV